VSRPRTLECVDGPAEGYLLETTSDARNATEAEFVRFLADDGSGRRWVYRVADGGFELRYVRTEERRP